MANIKISELNELTEKENDDYLAIVDTSASETKKISVKNLSPSNVELLAVTDTAPSECSIGDKYFNTTTNKIYTATATDTWGENGEDPIADILYVVIDDQKTYVYDGVTLISVGGGSGNLIVVGTDTPTEETKLQIESMDIEAQYELSEDIYSTEEVKTNKIWTNGKPIYRRVLITSLPTQESTWTTLITIDDIDQLINISGAISGYITIPFYLTANYYCNFQKNGNDIQVFTKGYPDSYTRIIIEYTKTN